MSKNLRYCIIPIFIPHQGCPHQCIFCNQRTITGQDLIPTPATIKKQIDDYVQGTMDKEFHLAFYGGSFTGIDYEEQTKLLQPAYAALKAGKIRSIRISTRPDYISKKRLSLLKEYNVGIVELGIQSMVDGVLYLSNRGHTVNDIYNAISLLKEMNFEIGLQVMPGLPGDTQETIYYTVRQIIGIQPDFVRIYPALVLKQTPLEILYYQGLYKPLSLDETVTICKHSYLTLLYHGIKVIRIGLQPTDYLASDGNIVAGPYHPALKYLVETEIACEMMYCLLDKASPLSTKKECFEANITFIANLYGYKRLNIERLKDIYNLADVVIEVNNNLGKNQIILRSHNLHIDYKGIYELWNAEDKI